MIETAKIQTPAEAVSAMLDQVQPVEEEQVALMESVGRITAQAIVADRRSPPWDVRAMVGYAVRLPDRSKSAWELADSVLPGRPAPALVSGMVIRIMTGAMVPAGTEAVIRREDVQEQSDRIVVKPGIVLKPGQNIRRCGENLPAAREVLPAGADIGPPVMTALASFGVARVRVRRRVKATAIVTGDELLSVEAPAEPWQIRDSNGPALEALLKPLPWVDWLGWQRVRDAFDDVLGAVQKSLSACDVLLLTGGVSAGTHDFVPPVLRQAGCRIIFHKLPIRPGHPVLGAIGPQGQLVMGLPGNPLSVMTTARRLAAPLLLRKGGGGAADPPRPVVRIGHADEKKLPMWWYRPVRLIGAGEGELVESKGSGDVVSAARSDGFVEIPPQQTGAGPWPFYGWSVGELL